MGERTSVRRVHAIARGGRGGEQQDGEQCVHRLFSFLEGGCFVSCLSSQRCVIWISFCCSAMIPSAKRRAVDATKGSAARAEAASAIPRSKTLKRRMKSPRVKALV